jgi:hypothetical protein
LFILPQAVFFSFFDVIFSKPGIVDYFSSKPTLITSDLKKKAEDAFEKLAEEKFEEIRTVNEYIKNHPIPFSFLSNKTTEQNTEYCAGYDAYSSVQKSPIYRKYSFWSFWPFYAEIQLKGDRFYKCASTREGLINQPWEKAHQSIPTFKYIFRNGEWEYKQRDFLSTNRYDDELKKYKELTTS